MQVDIEYLTHNNPSLAESCLCYELIHNLGLQFLLVTALIASGTALHDMTSLFHSVCMAALKLDICYEYIRQKKPCSADRYKPDMLNMPPNHTLTWMSNHTLLH